MTAGRVFKFAAAFTVGDTSSVGAHYSPYGITTGTPAINSGILRLKMNGDSLAPGIGGSGSTIASWAGSRIGMLQGMGFRIADEGSGTAEAIIASWFLGTDGFNGPTVYILLTRKRIDATNYRLRLLQNTSEVVAGATVLATGTTLLAWTVYYLWQVRIDTTNKTVEVKIGTSSVATEFNNVAYTDASPFSSFGSPYLSLIGDKTGIGSTAEMNFKPMVFYREDSNADDLDITTLNTFGLLATVAGAALYQDFSSVRNPAQTNANVYLNLDDWVPGNTAADGLTTDAEDLGTAGATYRQGVLTADPTITNPVLVLVISEMTSFVAGKKTTFGVGISDTSVGIDGPAIGIVTNNLNFLSSLFTTNADGSALTQAGLNAMQIYAYHFVSAAGDIGAVTALQGEVFGAADLFPNRRVASFVG